MANYPITKDQLVNASWDADVLAEVINGAVNRPNAPHPDGTVTTRLGLALKTIAKAVQDIVLSGSTDNAALNALAEYVQRQFTQLGFYFVSNTGRLHTDGETWHFSIVDEDGTVAVGVQSNGRITIGDITMETHGDSLFEYSLADQQNNVVFGIYNDGSVFSNGVICQYIDDPRYAFVVADESGGVGIGIRKNGVVDICLDSNKESRCIFANARTDIMQVISYGQSLSRGYNGSPALSLSQPYANKTFLSGVLPRGGDIEVDYSDFKLLVEETQETLVSTALNSLAALTDEATPDNACFFGTAPGVDGARIASLSPGSPAWDAMMEQVRATHFLSQQKALSHSVWALLWTQGEGDYLAGTSADDYFSYLTSIDLEYSAQVAEITKQKFAPPIIMYQVASHRYYGSDDHRISVAQWNSAARDGSNIVMACAMYAFDYSDNRHLTNEGYRQLGRYYAKALHESLAQASPWKPTSPTSIIWSGKIIDIAAHVPVGALVLNVDDVLAAPNYGFDIWNENALDSTAISSVVLAPGNRIRITLSREAQTGDVLTYARGRTGDPATSGYAQGPRGNFCDEAGLSDFYTDSNGKVRKMTNWLVMFAQEYNK